MLTINLRDLDEDPEELLHKLQALRKAGLQVSLQVKGNREQASQLFGHLPNWYGTNAATPQRLLQSLLPASAGALGFILLGIVLWL